MSHYKKLITDVYPGITQWCNQNNITSTIQLREYLVKKGMTISYHTLLTRLRGETEFTRSEIDLFLKISGYPYEILFKQIGE